MEIINEIDNEIKHSMKVRIITAIVMVLVIAPCIVFGNLLYLAFVLFIGVVATLELLKATKKKYSWPVYVTAFLVTFSLLLWPFVKNVFHDFTPDNPIIHWNHWYFMALGIGNNSPYGLFISTSAVAIAAGLLFFMVIVDKNFTVRDATFLFTFLLLLALCLQALSFLRFYPLTLAMTDEQPGAPLSWMSATSNLVLYEWFLSAMPVVYVLLGTFVTDIGAYFVGVLFGKHKMNVRISPKKTWEGFFGGVIFSAILSFTFAMIFAATGLPLLPIFTVERWYLILIVSLILPLTSTLGDFTFSAVKREFGIKDFGKIFPGHGGVLDRFDSLLFSSLAASILITFMMSGWKLIG